MISETHNGRHCLSLPPEGLPGTFHFEKKQVEDETPPPESGPDTGDKDESSEFTEEEEELIKQRLRDLGYM